VTPSAFRKKRGKTVPHSIRVGFAIATHAATERRGDHYA
jgi:hypothetical protein